MENADVKYRQTIQQQYVLGLWKVTSAKRCIGDKLIANIRQLGGISHSENLFH